MTDLKTIILDDKEYWLLPKINYDYNTNNTVGSLLYTFESEAKRIQHAIEKLSDHGNDLRNLQNKILDSIISLEKMKND